MNPQSDLPAILVVSRNFPPLTGGMERLIRHAVEQLAEDFHCEVIGPQGCESASSAPGFGCRIKPVPWFLLCAAWRGWRRAWSRRYQLCIAGSGVTAPVVVLLGKWFGMPSVVFIHGLDIIAPHPLYQGLFLPFIRRADAVIANSHNTMALARQKGIPPERITVIFPGVALPRHPPDPAPFIRTYGLQGKKILLAVGRIIPRKGLAEFVKYCLPAILRACPEAVLVIVGDEPTQALKQTKYYLSELQTAIARHHLENQVRFTGTVDDTTLERAYQAADVFVFPLRPVADDVEGFGMVAVEAAAHGVPTVAFEVGGVADAVAHDVSGKLVETGDYAGFTRAVVEVLQTRAITVEDCKRFAARFSWTRFGEQLRAFCRRYLKGEEEDWTP